MAIAYPNADQLTVGDNGVTIEGLALYTRELSAEDVGRSYSDAWHDEYNIYPYSAQLTVAGQKVSVPIYPTGDTLTLTENPAKVGWQLNPVMDVAWTGETYTRYMNLEWTVTETPSLSPITIQWTGYELNPTMGLEWLYEPTFAPTMGINWTQADLTNYPRTSEGWKLYVSIDSTDYSNKITGSASIVFEEDASSVADFILVPDAGAIDIMSWMNKEVIIDVGVFVSGSEVHRSRKFRGYVDNVTFNPDTGLLAFKAITDLQGHFEKMEIDDVKATLGGYWSEFVFESQNVSGWETAQDIMSTQPKSIWLDEYANLRIDNRAAKSTPDFTFTDSERFHNSLALSRATRRQLINTVNVDMDYKNIALRHREIKYVIDGGYQWSICQYLDYQWEFLTKSDVESLINSSGWVNISTGVTRPEGFNYITINEHWPADWIFCRGTRIGWLGADSDDYLAQATFTLAKRWAKTNIERYAIKVTAPNSVEYSGELPTSRGVTVESEYDYTDWEKDEAYTTEPAGATQLANGDWEIDTTSDSTIKGSRADADLAQETLLAFAKNEILESHRQNKVSFSIPYHPVVNLSNTVRINTPHLTAKGKVRRVAHEFNIERGSSQTSLVLALSLHGGTGSYSDTALDSVTPPDDQSSTEPTYDQFRALPMKVGGTNISSQYDEDWEGWITNTVISGGTLADKFSPTFYQYPVGLVIDTTSIAEESIEALDLQQTADITVDIPQDELTIIA